jgi:transcriptional regulator with XRE-family HTH domain
MSEQNFRDYLQNEFLLRCRKNPRYSIRAFARAMNIDHSTLSQLLRGKRPLTHAMINKLGQNLKLDESQIKMFLKNVKQTRADLPDFKSLTLDTYAIISDWYHYALFELVTVKHFKPDPNWIAKTLAISPEEALHAIERLKRVGLIEVDANGVWKQSSKNITTLNNDFTAEAFRNLQKGLLQLSMKALEEVPFEKRSHTSMTMAFNSKRLPEAKTRITKFRRELCDWLQKDMQRDAVYEMTFSLFPVTPLESESATL